MAIGGLPSLGGDGRRPLPGAPQGLARPEPGRVGGSVVLVTSPLPHFGPRGDLRPTVDDFGARGAVKERADVVLGLFREGMYDGARGIEGATELLVRKNRNGGTGYVDLYFYEQWMRFEDLLDPDR